MFQVPQGGWHIWTTSWGGGVVSLPQQADDERGHHLTVMMMMTTTVSFTNTVNDVTSLSRHRRSLYVALKIYLFLYHDNDDNMMMRKLKYDDNNRWHWWVSHDTSYQAETGGQHVWHQDYGYWWVPWLTTNFSEYWWAGLPQISMDT